MFSYKTISGIFFALCMVFAVILGALIFVARQRTSLIIEELSVDRVLASKQGFVNYLDDLSERALLRGGIIAKQKVLIDAIKEYEASGIVLDGENTDFPQYETIKSLLNDFLQGYDFISVVDRNGCALARVDTGERNYPLPLNGYNLMVNPDVKITFDTGEPTASITFMLDNTTLVATTLYPIYDGDDLLGVVTCLYDLTNPKYLEAYKQQSGSEVAIFLGQEEFVSTLRSSSNISVVAGPNVVNAIFDNKENTYVEFIKIDDVEYGTVFSPLVYHGDMIGMLFTGINVNSAMSIKSEMDALIALIAMLAFVIVFIFVMIIQRYNKVIKKQIYLRSAMTNISQSFLSDEDIDKLITKAFADIGPLVDVSQILMFREKPDDPSKFICTNEWYASNVTGTTYSGFEMQTPGALFKAYMKLRFNDTFYITSDDKKVREALAPYRFTDNDFLTTCIFLDDRVHAFIDFSRPKSQRKWTRESINAASFLANIFTGALHKKRVEEQLVAAKEVAEKSNQSKSAFLANVSHEIRTPMNAILGITEIYLQDKSARDTIDDGLSMIYDSGNLLLGIINDILDLSRIEAGRLEIIPVNYDIPSLINDTVQICRLRYGSKPIEFVLDVDKWTPINLFGDELRIRQILNNILSNAFKYTETGKIELMVSAGPDTIDEQVSEHGDMSEQDNDDITLIFRVRDTGQGMTPEQIDTLFDEFVRFNMDINRTIVGTGLGMSITKSLVELMNGEIFVESEKDVGSTFTVKLPQKRIDKSICGSEISEKLKSFSFHSMSLHKKAQVICEYMPYGSVLVVDDVESNLFVSKGMLLPYGLKIETASSGFEAIDYITGGKQYDIIFMDHMMPKMDGIETTRNIRAMGYTGYIIALTANALVGQDEIFLSNGFDGYIPKPIDTRELNAKLIEFIRDKKPQDVVNAAREEAREAELLKTLDVVSDTAEPVPVSISADDIPDVEACFVIDAQKTAGILKDELDKLNGGGDIDIDNYRVAVHGMKSALLIIKERELSGFAYTLEMAALSDDLDTIREKTTEFINALEATAAKYDKK